MTHVTCPTCRSHPLLVLLHYTSIHFIYSPPHFFHAWWRSLLSTLTKKNNIPCPPLFYTTNFFSPMPTLHPLYSNLYCHCLMPTSPFLWFIPIFIIPCPVLLSSHLVLISLSCAHPSSNNFVFFSGLFKLACRKKKFFKLFLRTTKVFDGKMGTT